MESTSFFFVAHLGPSVLRDLMRSYQLQVGPGGRLWASKSQADQ